ncbi:MAG TPA: DHA2 family efflux MFS transporter permease subunit [Vicinamibacterales bacterium]|jgi:DHA2 family multidrug resistance protein|nr:DHA2 family efflux MFS transporter permease subunit [Vicinamibacterales bacterium]
MKRHNQWAIALTVTLATFMEVMDTSIANVSLNHIAGGLSASVDEATWVLTSYLVSNAIVLPISAWLAERFGRKRFYMTCVALFTMSSFCCGIAPSLGALIFFRVLQGIGGGGLAPSEQAILADTFEPAKRGMAFAIYGMAVVLAPTIGPTLGGYITDNASWRWIFFINIPVGLLSLYLTNRIVEDPPHLVEAKKAAHEKGIDVVGLVLVALGLGLLQIVADTGQRDDWFAAPHILVLTIVGCGALVWFLFWESRHPHPIVNLRLFKNRNFAASALLMLALGCVLYSSIVLIPQFLQILMGYTAQLAGEVLSVGGMAILILMPLVGWLVGKTDARYLIAFGFVVTGLSLFKVTELTLAIDFHTAVMWAVYQRIGLAFLFVPINTISYVGVPKEDNNQVSGIINVMRNMGGSIGISAVTTLLARRNQVHQTDLVANLYGGNPTLNTQVRTLARYLHERGASNADATHQAYGQLYGVLQRQVNALSYVDAFWILGIVCFVITPLVFIAKRPEPGQAAMGH